MSMIHRPGARRAVAAAITIAALATGVGVGRTASTVSTDVAAALAAVPGSMLLVDDSSASGCMTGSPETVAFRSDRIVLRTAMTELQAAGVVAGAFPVAGWTATPRNPTRLTFPAPGPTSVVPVVWMTLDPPAKRPEQVVALARKLTEQLLVPAAPDMALSPTGGPLGMWPSGYPTPPTRPFPAARLATYGAGLSVTVYDTGQPESSMATVSANLTMRTPSDVDAVDGNGDGTADLYYAGHTNAIASTIGTMAPGAKVVAARITEPNGVATDVAATTRMTTTLKQAAAANTWPSIIVAPFGSPSCEGLALPGLAMVSEAVDRHDRSLIVASAGNRGTDRPFYPAAFDGVLAVGSLNATADGDTDPWTSPTRTAPRSSFSNYGPWVDAYAPGEGLVTNHVKGIRFTAKGPTLAGAAEVAGSSYSNPYLVGLLLEQMSLWPGRRAEDVWNTIVKPTGLACTGSGGGTGVALTAMNASATTRAPNGSVTSC